MYFLVLSIGLLLVGSSLEDAVSTNRELSIPEECMADNGVTLTDFMDLHTGKKNLDDVPDNLKCAAHCMLANMGIMDDNGYIKLDPKQPSYEELRDLAATCGTVEADNPCDRAFMIAVCMYMDHADVSAELL